MIRISNVSLALDQGARELLRAVARKLGTMEENIRSYRVVRQSVDARNKENIRFVYTVDVEVAKNPKGLLAKHRTNPHLKEVQPFRYQPPQAGVEPLGCRPVVVGAGPAGIFAALTLARQGYRPLVLERGQDVDTRTKDVAHFWAAGELNLDSNVQFGEGGAGTFSDGKLTTRIDDPRVEVVLATLVEAGAPEEIGFMQKPHVGTDILRRVVTNLRQELVALGGEVRFGAMVTGLLVEQGRLRGVVANGGQEVEAEVVVMATGHSARDTYQALHQAGVELQAKPFAMGVRIEHPQGLIDQAQYGSMAGHPKLGAADYHLTYQNKEAGRAAYTFCMCPGGQVVAAASEAGRVVTNGMSDFARDSGVANSALVVSVEPKDFGGTHPLAGMEFQQDWEDRAYRAGGGGYKAPAQTVGDFLAGRPGSDLEGLGTYRPGLTPVDLHSCLPTYVSAILEEAIVDMDRRLRGFNSAQAVLTGIETRTSAPVRIIRGEDRQAIQMEGLYPAGEGAGYAGGIVSAAVDGIKTAEKIISRFQKGD
ncbi:MAG: FAD-binding protein [Clostridia bacterium]|nr:FAD-binding protein [Clostridia bacterium]